MSELVVDAGTAPAGLPGLEAIWTWDEAVVINDRNTWPRFKLKVIGGLYSKADLSAQADPAIGRIGEVSRRASKAGKTITLEGDAQARSLAEMRSSIAQAAVAFAPDDERTMYVVQHPSLGSQAYTFTARCVAFECSEEQRAARSAVSYGYERPFVIGLRLSDPRFYSTEQQQAETGELAISAGVTFPLVKPVVFPESAAVGTVELVVDGSAPTDPTISLYGPVVNPRIANLTLGVDLRFSSLTLAEGEFVRIDFAARQVLLGGETDARGALDLAASTWWDAGVVGLAPGSNQLRYSGDTIADPATAIATWRDAYWA